MNSQFTRKRGRITATATPQMDETYDLRGLNLTDPDQVMKKGQSPYNLNSRMYARDDDEEQVAIRTRKGSTRLTVAIGQTLDTQNVGASTGDVEFSTTRILAQPFVATASGPLTKLSLEIKKIAAATGPVIVELWSDNAGTLGSRVADSSIPANTITTSFQYLDAYFMDAPSVVATTRYWEVVYIQDNGTGSYYLNGTANSTPATVYSEDEMVSFTDLGSAFRFKSYVSTAGGIKGYARRYPSDASNRTIIAHGDTLQAVDDSGNYTSINASLSSLSTYMRMVQNDDELIYTNGIDPIRWWNGTTDRVINGVTGTPTNAIIYKERLFLLTERTLVRFSEKNDFETYSSVNFFYVPSPLSSDPVTGWMKFQDGIHIFTHETKHVIRGYDISTFQRDEMSGTRGAVSQESMAKDKNYIYFLSDDKQIYRWNGITDQLISRSVQRELQTIQDPSKVRFHLYRNQLRVYYPKSPSSFNNQMLLLDMDMTSKESPEGEWFMDTGRYVVGSLELNQDENQLVEFSSRVGQLFNGETGTSDMGKAIDWKYWTNYKAYTSGAAKDRIKRFRPILRGQDSDYTMQVGKDIDFQNNPSMKDHRVSSSGARWGAFVWGDGSRWGSTRNVDSAVAMNGRGKYTQYRFERRGVDTPVELYGYISQLKSGRPK